MKNRLMHNWQLKLLSLAMAVGLWFVVVSINDPVQTKPYGGIPVEVINDSVITSEGKVYEILDNSNNISIEVTARRSVLEKLGRDDFKAVANMQDIQLMKYVPINVSCTKNVVINDITTKTPNLQISIEDSDTKTLPIVVRTIGTPGDGYVIDKVNTIASPESVRITGAASVIKKISKVYAEVDVSGITMDTDRVTALKLYDNDGDIIKNTSLKYNVDVSKIDVLVKLLKTKEIPIRASASGDVEDGYRYTKISCEPSTITLAGSAEVLKNITMIEIPESAIDVSGATEDVEKVLDITAYLPDDTQLATEEEATVAVTVAVEKLENQTVTIKKSQIELLNVADGRNVTFLTNTDLSVQIRALKKSLDGLDTSEWEAHVDLLDYREEGTVEVPVTIVLPEGYELVDTPIAVLKIELENAEDE